MSCELLLHWMTHKGEGSWTAFRRALAEIVPNVDDPSAFARYLRVTLSDLSHADFFVDGSQRWRILSPMLAGSATNDSAVLCGSRTPALLLSLQSASHTFGCQLSNEVFTDAPSRITLIGSSSDIRQTAEKAQINFLPRASAQLLGVVDSIATQIEIAPDDAQPFQWDAESFSLTSRTWVSGVMPNSACRFTQRHGAQKFMLHRRHKKFLRLPKRDAVYASAMIQGVSLIEYDADSAVMQVPITAPMPEKLARVACLCTGTQPRIDRGFIQYEGIPFDIASAILVAAGQLHPGLAEFAENKRCSVG